MSPRRARLFGLASVVLAVSVFGLRSVIHESLYEEAREGVRLQRLSDVVATGSAMSWLLLLSGCLFMGLTLGNLWWLVRRNARGDGWLVAFRAVLAGTVGYFGLLCWASWRYISDEVPAVHQLRPSDATATTRDAIAIHDRVSELPLANSTAVGMALLVIWAIGCVWLLHSWQRDSDSVDEQP